MSQKYRCYTNASSLPASLVCTARHLVRDTLDHPHVPAVLKTVMPVSIYHRINQSDVERRIRHKSDAFGFSMATLQRSTCENGHHFVGIPNIVRKSLFRKYSVTATTSLRDRGQIAGPVFFMSKQAAKISQALQLNCLLSSYLFLLSLHGVEPRSRRGR